LRRALLTTLCTIWVAVAPGMQPPLHEEARQVMGTLATVQVWADDATAAAAAADSAFVVFAAVDSLLSTWNSNSALSRLNAAPAGRWVSVGPEACTVLRIACDVAELSGGAFDPTVLPLVHLWGFRHDEPALPDSQALAAVLADVNWRKLEVTADRARLARPGMAIDLGGIAKGHALDRAAVAMARAGATGGVLDLGGNLLAFGAGPGTVIGVVAPDAPGALALTIPLGKGAVATSGQYERFVTIDGQAYGHILDPRTGLPVAPGISATVVAPSALWADALATAVVVMGRAAGLALLEELPDVEGAVVTTTEIHVTSGWTTR
jgi:thiamine biosynthesis lipoprotein